MGLKQPMQVERLGESGGHCDCCGNQSRSVWGLIHGAEGTIAAYWMNWTVGHLEDHGANLDLVIGAWGEKAQNDQRVAVSLLHRQRGEEGPALMIIDAADREPGHSNLAGSLLARSDVIGTPLANLVFDLVDIIYEQDDRFF